MANHNVLDGIACPQCGYENAFRIGIIMYAEVLITDDGYDLNDVKHQETEWNDTSSCKCLQCGFAGFVGDFQIERI